MLYISISSLSRFDKPHIVQLEDCADVAVKKQAEYIGFVVARSGQPFNFLNTYRQDHLSWFTISNYTCRKLVLIARNSTLWCS